MNAEIRCPQDDLLRRVLDAELSPEEEHKLTDHLRTCPICRQRLDELTRQDSLISDQAGSLLGRDDHPDEALARMVDKLRAQGPLDSDETAELNQDTPNNPIRHSGSEICLDFLTTSGNPQSLGRFGCYEITGVVGSGGMGIVLKALDTSLNRIVAIKVLRPELAANATARGRFQAEAKAAAAITHDHVVTIHAVGEEDGLPYLVMEYIVGVSLEERIKRTGPLKLTEILRIGMQAAAGLAAAHSQGLVHRDVKPSNILLENGVERVKIVDFGLAKATDDLRLTQSGVVAGTPEYMSPEQTRGRNVDHRSDLFSLGCVLYATCAGRSPFRASTIIDAIHRVCDDTPRPIQEINSEIPDWFVEIVNQLLAKDPGDRFQSSAQVGELLGEHLAHIQQPAQFPRPPRVPLKSGARRPTGSSRRIWSIAAAVACVVLLAIGAQVFWRASEPIHIDGITGNDPPVANGIIELSIAEDSGRWFGRQVRIRGDGYDETFAEGVEREVELAPGKYEIEVRAKQTKELNRKGMMDVRPGERHRIRIRHSSWERAPLLRHHDAIAEIASTSSQGPHIHALSPSGLVLAASGVNSTIELWSSLGSQWQPAGTLTGQTGEMYCLRFSPDGATLAASGQDGTVTVWSLDSKQVIRRIENNSKPVFSISFSPDGSLLASSGADSEAVVWELATGQPRLRITTGQPGVIAFSPDGKLLSSGSLDGSIAFWKASDGTLIRRFTGHSNWIASLDFSPDGTKLVSASPDSTAKVWNVSTGTCIHTLGFHRAEVPNAVFSPSGEIIASVCKDNAVRLWDAVTGRMLEEYRAHWSDISRATFSTDGTALVTSGSDGTIRIWNVNEILRDAQKSPPDPPIGTSEISLYAVTGSGKVSSCFGLSPDANTLVVGKEDGSFSLLTLPDLQSIFNRVAHPDSRISTVEFLPNGTLFVTASQQQIKLWDTASGTVNESIAHGRSSAFAAVSPHQDTLAINHGDKVLMLRSWTNPNNIRILQADRRLQGRPVFSADGAFLAALTKDNQVLIWNTKDYEQVSAGPILEQSNTSAIRFSPDNKLLALGSRTGMITLWEVGSWRRLHMFKGITGEVRDISFSPDGRIVAAGGGKGNTNHGEEVDPDRWDGRVALWDVETGRELTQFRAHLGATWQVGFTSDGTRLITLGDPKTLRVWDIRQVLENLPSDVKTEVSNAIAEGETVEASHIEP